MKPSSLEHRVGRRVRRLRRAAGLSLDSLAARAGVSKSLLSKIENARVAAAIGATVGDLLGEGRGSDAS